MYGLTRTPLCSGGCGFIDGIVAEVKFPQCYDGITPPRPADFAYDTSGTCPSGFTHKIPFVSLRFHLGIMDPCPGTVAAQCGPNLTDASKILLTFSSGPYYTMHADFWNTWKQTRLNQQIGKTPSGALVLPACLQPKHYSNSPPSCGFLPS